MTDLIFPDCVNFPLDMDSKEGKKISEIGVTDFRSLCAYVQNLPYGRNKDQADPWAVIHEQKGSCSGKHLILKRIAESHGQTAWKLMCGIFRMNRKNTAEVKHILDQFGIMEIPEAHCYLKNGNQYYDFTKTGSRPENFLNELLLEREMQIEEIPMGKLLFHQNFLKQWLNHRVELPYTFEQLWSIREACIAGLALSDSQV